MDEVVNIALTLSREGIGILPWLVAVLLLFAFIYYKDDFRSYLKEKATAQKKMAELEGERIEVTRNNTAALNHNTVAFEMFSKEKEVMLEALKSHEDMSNERFSHLQTVTNQCRDEALAIRKEIAVLNAKIK